MPSADATPNLHPTRRTLPSLPSQQSASPGPDTPPALCGAEAAAEREPHCSRGCAVSCATGTALKAARRAFNKASKAAGGRVKKARVGTPEGTKDMARMGMGGRQVLPTPSLRTTGFVDETRVSGVLPVPALFVIFSQPSVPTLDRDQTLCTRNLMGWCDGPATLPV